MALTQAHELGYTFERTLERRFRSLKIPKAKTLAAEISGLLMDVVPSEAFDPKDAWQAGYLFYSGEIGEKRARKLRRDLVECHVNLRKNVALRIHFNSVGGYVDDGLGIVSTIQELQRDGRTVNIHVQGFAMSMASVILQSANKRTIEPYGFLMIHESKYDIPEAKKLSEHREALAFEERLDDACTALYRARTGKPVEYYKKKFERRDWYLSAPEALEEGLVDEITVSPTYKRFRRRK